MKQYIPTFDQFLIMEGREIATITEPIKIEVRIEATIHSDERKYRHENENLFITDEQIIEATQKALSTIAQRQIRDFDNLTQKYWISCGSKLGFLNIVGEFTRQREQLIFRVITVMLKEKFFGSKDAIKIII